MRMKDLLENWERAAGERRTPTRYSVRLPVSDAAKIAALKEMYPGRSEEDIITDILSAGLDELEEAFPYIPGRRVVAEDEQGDPIHEDAGPTPLFQRLTEKHLQRLQAAQQAH